MLSGGRGVLAPARPQELRVSQMKTLLSRESRIIEMNAEFLQQALINMFATERAKLNREIPSV